ncbi:MAG: hypothetical protein DRJ03_23135 [Chloroflexi bacterium]|nr:MAG: hypothetical protein DRJ03_23135 [Chloroflexota bacterium]
MIRGLLVSLLVLVACTASAQNTEEFTVSLSSGSNSIELSEAYTHFQVSVTEDLTIRFVAPNYNSSGALTGFKLYPMGGSAVADSGPHPDLSDTTMVCNTAQTWNVYNDLNGVKKIFIHGSAGSTSAVIRCKR